MSKEAKAFWAIFFCFAIILSGWHYGISLTQYKRDTVDIPIRTNIEGAIEVAGFENKFTFVESVGLGGAGGGGMGAPQVNIDTIEKFISLVRPGNDIYVTFEFEKKLDGSASKTVFKKIYWSMKDGAALVYEDVYTFRNFNKSYWVESYDEDTITFNYNSSYDGDYLGLLWAPFGIMAFIGLICLLVAYEFYKMR